jgi:predicted nucleotidyltransferase
MQSIRKDGSSINDSARMTWVRVHAAQLIQIAASFGATGVCLCGSVARGDDTDDSDLDFYVRSFDDTLPDARGRADGLVESFRALSPYRVDVRPLPGWRLDSPYEATMQRDSIELSLLARRPR